jgi:trehalose 6-phosphate phosphatase
MPPEISAAGKAGVDALLAEPRTGLIASDFDGTLSPIVSQPGTARPAPGAIEVLTRLAAAVGTVAIITGRAAEQAVLVGGLDTIPGVIVLGHYGAERWEGGSLTAAAAPPGVAVVRAALPGLISGAAAGTRIEDKGFALAVHTRQTADPVGTLESLRPSLETLAKEAGLALEPGRFVLELRPPGVDKGAALRGLVAERSAGSAIYCGDDLGDLAAFAAIRQLRSEGIPGATVCSATPEAARVAAQVARDADIVTDGPAGIVAFLEWLASSLHA